jgi:hypothetical protein
MGRAAWSTIHEVLSDPNELDAPGRSILQLQLLSTTKIVENSKEDIWKPADLLNGRLVYYLAWAAAHEQHHEFLNQA